MAAARTCRNASPGGFLCARTPARYVIRRIFPCLIAQIVCSVHTNIANVSDILEIAIGGICIKAYQTVRVGDVMVRGAYNEQEELI